MRKNSFWFLPLMLLFALCVIMFGGGGCGGSSHSRSNNSDKLADAISDITEDLEDIATRAMSSEVTAALDNIIGQYTILSSADTGFMDRALVKSIMADATSEDIEGNPLFSRVIKAKLWTNKHVTVTDNVATVSDLNASDFQLTITSNDHVTKLTVTPTSTTRYWTQLNVASVILNTLFPDEVNKRNYLLCVETPAAANVTLTYDNKTLLSGTVSLSYPNISTYGDIVSAFDTHTSTFNATLNPSDTNYSIGFKLNRNVTASSSRVINSTSDLALTRSTGKTLLGMKAGLEATMPANITLTSRVEDAKIKNIDVNVGDKIRLAQSGTVDLKKLRTLYETGTNASESTINSNVTAINKMISDAGGFPVYLNQETDKAGDVTAMAGTLGTSSKSYPHVRFGILFTGEDEPELVKNIANPEDLTKLRNIVSSFSTKVNTLVGLLSGTGTISDLADNTIIQLIFSDLFGTN